MQKIRVLPDILSNKIAAGEVVERPASVVKELLENSLDAGSTSIELSVERGGVGLIRIADNGQGMTPDDALLSLERYATSKIAKDSDLFAIKTLGFRGEALPSIVSVSSFELVSREKDRDSGIRIVAEGGRILDAMETGAAPGTVISVRRLFFNVPARRKFLKSEITEMGHIADTLLSTALSFPHVQFRLLNNGKTVRHLGAGDDFLRAVDVLGKDFEKNLYPVGQEGDGIRVRGWVASPDISRSNSQRIYLYVNGRHIRDRAVHQALCEGYRGRLMTGRYPVAVLFLEVDPEKVDVNVHPTKHEVRFSDGRAVWSLVRDAVSSALSFEDRAKWQAARLSQKEEREEMRTIVASRSVLGVEPEGEPVFRKTSENSSASGEMLESYEPVSITEKEEGKIREKQMDFSSEVSSSSRPSFTPKVSFPEKDDFLWKKKSFYSELRVIGQLHATYIVCESDNGIVLVDQHAAHERVRYEALRRRHEEGGGGASQQLLVPEVVELGYKEAAAALALIPELARLGLHVEPFGGNSFVIKAVPDILSHASLGDVFRDMAEDAASGGHTGNLAERIDESLILMACHSAIRANQKLQAREIEHLFTELDACLQPSRCPHGRPIWIQWDRRFLEKSFGRIG